MDTKKRSRRSPEKTRSSEGSAEEHILHARRQFLEASTHYLSTPISSVLGLTELLQNRSRDSSAGVRNQLIDLLGIQASELSHVLANLVLATEIDLEGVELRREPVQLREVVETTLRSWDQRRRTRFTVSGEATALADPSRVALLIRNLLRSVESSGGQEIHVRLTKKAKRVALEVSADSIQLAGSSLVMHPNRTLTHVDESNPGLDLGISVAHRLAKAQGGDLEIRQEHGATLFELTLPPASGHQATESRDVTVIDPYADKPTDGSVVDILVEGGPTIVYQPIVDMRSHREDQPRIVGYESLARFPHASPPEWFEAASNANMRHDLELAAIRTAVAGFDPPSNQPFLALNLSDGTLNSSKLDNAISAMDPGRIVLELSEIAAIKSYEMTNRAVDALRERGVRLAVDDVGSGEIDLWHVLRLDPSVVKIDMCLVRDLEQTPRNAALIRGITAMCVDLGIMVVAEGVETERERDRLIELGVEFAQGYLFGKPGPLSWKAKVLTAEPHLSQP